MDGWMFEVYVRYVKYSISDKVLLRMVFASFKRSSRPLHLLQHIFRARRGILFSGISLLLVVFV